MTVNDCVTDAADVLIRAGFAPGEARRDASVLARHLLGWSLAMWAAGTRDPAPADLQQRLHAAVRRRATHEPVAYITGVREFYGRDFHVTPAVLIPRPETEALAELAIEATSGPHSSIVVDVGTGSGCVAVTIALECPGERVIATDVSPAALDVARENAKQLGARVEFVQSSLLPPTPQVVDVIVSNPPYVPRADEAVLPPDVREFEPALALYAEDDGLAVIRALIWAARARLRPLGWLLMEIGEGQSAAVDSLLRSSGLRLERFVPDLQGIPRVVVARQPRSSA
ncbi:MAG TPA: peptide chain release factor N(5)-glutamine methyltransferase [Vicinamibacterales bacterium]|nr:peptide chain release factor N(5)-glutamine methyltransferase [Vicinamibacterales bacterium]